MARASTFLFPSNTLLQADLSPFAHGPVDAIQDLQIDYSRLSIHGQYRLLPVKDNRRHFVHLNSLMRYMRKTHLTLVGASLNRTVSRSRMEFSKTLFSVQEETIQITHVI